MHVNIKMETNFTNKNLNIYPTIILITLLATLCNVHASIHVDVTNELENGLNLTIHCRSKDDDLGYHVLEEGRSVLWSFNANFWGSTLFYCDVKWGENSNTWYHFDAYDDDRDYWRCWSRCQWRIRHHGSLFGYDEDLRVWEWFPMSATE